VLGVPNPTQHLEFERKVKGRKIDVFYEDRGILIEMKGRGISLDKATERSKRAGAETPYEQALWYAGNLPWSARPRYIITCNFDEFRIYDQEKENAQEYVQFTLDELPEYLYLLSFFTNRSASRLEREKELSVKAGELVGKLYSQLSKQYKNIDTDEHEQRSLNVLIVRLVFLMYAEDSQLLQEPDAFLNYLKEFSASQTRQAIIDLFAVLDTPEDERDPYLSDELNAFPYINGGLFGRDDITIPQFNEDTREILLGQASAGFNWSHISPTIFGAVFESTLNPETRRAGGMHYTSIENIHKVIDPLFLDDLRAELVKIEGEKVQKTRHIKLRAFQQKLAGINILEKITTKLIRLAGVLNLGVSRGVLGCRIA
jgi:molybdopterin converting factor small subunit